MSDTASAARKRAAVELIRREQGALLRVARRYSICVEDAEDAYQRALEIVLLKAPSERPRDLVRWTTTVVKHEALAIRAQRERLLGRPQRGLDDAPLDRVAGLPARGIGPAERVERGEGIARSREALQALKPAELRALTLLAAGYSYAEIAAETGYSRTKVNRVLTEGRERYRGFLAGGEEGRRCERLAPLLSAHCDGEADPAQSRAVRAHLRACAPCRAAVRAYRAAPAAAAALAPVPALPRSLLERAQEAWIGLWARLPGGSGGAESGIAQAAGGGGSRGAGMAALAKLLAVCAGTAGGACVATGVAPLPIDLTPERAPESRIERPAPVAEPAPEAAPAPAPSTSGPEPRPEPEQRRPAPAETPPPVAEAGAVEYAPPPTPPAAPTGPAPDGNPAGEFGP